MTAKPKPRAVDTIIIHMVTDGDDYGWVHTHGLADMNLPELEIRDVPLFLAYDAVAMLNAVADYMMETGNVISAGQTMLLGNRHLKFENGEKVTPDTANHYEMARLRIIDPPELRGACESSAHTHDEH